MLFDQKDMLVTNTTPYWAHLKVTNKMKCCAGSTMEVTLDWLCRLRIGKKYKSQGCVIDWDGSLRWRSKFKKVTLLRQNCNLWENANRKRWDGWFKLLMRMLFDQKGMLVTNTPAYWAHLKVFNKIKCCAGSTMEVTLEWLCRLRIGKKYNKSQGCIIDWDDSLRWCDNFWSNIILLNNCNQSTRLFLLPFSHR
jgi:hypothetical protein